MTNPQEIIESSGAQWIGIQKTGGESLVLFRDPQTGTCLALLETLVAVDAVISKVRAARASFGITEHGRTL